MAAIEIVVGPMSGSCATDALVDSGIIGAECSDAELGRVDIERPTLGD